MAEKRKINVSLDHSEPGFYTDNVAISHNASKFIFDFIQMTPRFDRVGDDMKQTLAIKHNTVVMDPVVAKNILEILGDNLKKYEKNFGKIEVKKKKSKEKPTEFSEEATRYIG